MKKQKISKLIVSTACLILLTILYPGFSIPGVQKTYAQETALSQESPLPTKNPKSRAPQYISIQMEKPRKVLIAGEKGRLVIKAGLAPPQHSKEQPMVWDAAVPTPLIVWIATPPESGITFIDREHPEKPRHHIMVRFSPAPGDTSHSLKTAVEYIVNPRTKAGQHYFWLDIYGRLRSPDRNRIQDMGGFHMPVKVDTHLHTKLLMLAVICAAVFLFIVEWIRVDVIAIAIMVLLPELGLLNAGDTFKGLSSNAVIAIIGVMIISNGLNRAGLVNRAIQPVLKYVGKSPRRLTLIFSCMISAISSVMQNTGAAVLFLPAIRLTASFKVKVPVSRVLMPIGMAAILGGTMTMIGTSPLILLNDILPQGMPKFGFLELTPIGIALTVGGITYLSTIGMRMLAHRQDAAPGGSENSGSSEKGDFLNSYPLIQGPFEIYVPEDYQPGMLPQSLNAIRKAYTVNIVATAKGVEECDIAPLPENTIHPSQILCAYGPVKEIHRFIQDFGLFLRKEPKCFKDNMFNPYMAGLVEGVVSPRSRLIGNTIEEIRFRKTFGLNPLAIHQSGRTYYRELREIPLQAGDTILIHGTWEQLHTLEDLHRNIIIITPFETEFHKPEKSGRALICFGAALMLMLLSSFYFQKLAYNPIPLSVCLMAGAVGMVLLRVITINEAYRAVDWRTVFLLGGLIPLGMAMDQTGTAEWMAREIVSTLGGSMTPLVLLIVLSVLSCAFTTVISNVGACTLLIPVGISIAQRIGMDPRVAAMVVGIGVSNSFILPTHQVNALYMGPGSYRTKDYLKIGGPLAGLYIAILVSVVYLFYL